MTNGSRLVRRIAVGVDTSVESRAALQWAWSIVGAFAGELVVVHGVGLLEDSGYRPRVDVDSMVEEVRRQSSSNPDLHATVVVEDGPAADVIVRVADRCDAQLIVVGSRGLGQSPRLLGSVSEAVLAHAHLPVLIVPAP